MKKSISLFLIFSVLILTGTSYAKKKGAELVIVKLDSQQVRGELIAVKENLLLLLERETGADVTVDIEDIRSIKIVKKSKVLLGAGTGLLVLGGAGYFIGGQNCNECGADFCTSNAALGGAITAGLGALIGGTVGAIVGKDKTIQIEGKSDSEIQEILEDLRKKARVTDFQ